MLGGYQGYNGSELCMNSLSHWVFILSFRFPFISVFFLGGGRGFLSSRMLRTFLGVLSRYILSCTNLLCNLLMTLKGASLLQK